MNPDNAILLALFLPYVGALGIWITGRDPNLRESITLATALMLLISVLTLLPAVASGERPSLTLLQIAPGLSLSFTIEPLGMLFAIVAAGLWPLNSVYSIGYMRGNQEKNQTRFYICFAIAIASAMGIAFAGNMLTLFIFYEVLTLSTYPLVTHKGNADAMRSGRVYLGILLSTSIGFLLLAVIWTWYLAGTLDFTAGGILTGKIEGLLLPILLGLYMFGIGKAALMPFHRWLPAAMVAPTPVSALLHAVAVVKAGVFTVVKVTVYIFGIDLLSSTGASEWLVWVAAITLTLASLIALSKDNLKARLAYSTVSQLSYVVLGAMLATTMGVMGGALQIAMHAVGKITLFFCAGAIYTATHKTEISQMDGLGRVMPFTYGAFLIGSLSIIGLPPLGGSWSKWYLMVGAADAGQLIMIGVLMLSSLLNVAYLLPIVARGFFLPGPNYASQDEETSGIRRSTIREAPLTCVIPLSITAIGCILLFFFADSLYD
ncbi:MAG: monovalent cation/H+ antiporter subunit D family protein, partial [Candidatus Competibacteraceae bacterium]|nr:monovalent cation/H+ antiporter subunit D family protein [Candidatus Competibacteraceae bacterium]